MGNQLICCVICRKVVPGLSVRFVDGVCGPVHICDVCNNTEKLKSTVPMLKNAAKRQGHLDTLVSLSKEKMNVPKKVQDTIKIRPLEARLSKCADAYFVCRHRETEKKQIIRGQFGGISIYLYPVGEECGRSHETKWEPFGFFTQEDLDSLHLESSYDF